jgi:hypothetical protein
MNEDMVKTTAISRASGYSLHKAHSLFVSIVTTVNVNSISAEGSEWLNSENVEAYSTN